MTPKAPDAQQMTPQAPDAQQMTSPGDSSARSATGKTDRCLQNAMYTIT